MIYAQCNRCLNDKYHLDANTDDAFCTLCEKKFPSNKRHPKLVSKDEKPVHEAKSKFNSMPLNCS